ncbi:MAG: MFS transporter [Gammaproteobacteria bacterium CG11_big_fil_rev_8_21_14_0_20_46_22]|nr:MAG: MFS transporter [Gammaproteobacteria bacterium CG12_big_fil_rev_8_21_14_0_65_46_12]PIR10152.1 MAG: MFS transporter [Gammaproteobacteria bacterium CG11_big_fil_rev_8_21_14_0_20_46_22]
MALITSALERLDDRYHPLIPWVVCLSGGLLFFYEFIQLNIFGSLNTSVMRTFSLSAHQLGNLSSTYFYANACFLFVAGNLLDRYSTRKLILVAMVLCTLGTIGFAISANVWEAGVSRFFVGLGGAFCFLSGVRLASRWFPPSRMALLTGVLVTMAMIGGWLAQAPMAMLLEHMHWRNAMLLNGLLGVVLTVWIWLVIKDRPDGHDHIAMSERQQIKEMGLMQCIGGVLKNPQNWKAAFYTCLMNLPIYIMGALWGSLFLTQVHHFTAVQAASIVGMLYFGTIFGSPLVGMVSDKIKNRRKPMLYGAAISFFIMAAIIYIPSLSYDMLIIMFFLLGFITSSQVIGYPVAAESNPTVITGTSVSIVSMVTVFSGAIMQPISGWVLDHYWKGQYCGGVHCYNLQAYQHAMLVMLFSFVISFVLAWSIRETHSKPFSE